MIKKKSRLTNGVLKAISQRVAHDGLNNLTFTWPDGKQRNIASTTQNGPLFYFIVARVSGHRLFVSSSLSIRRVHTQLAKGAHERKSIKKKNETDFIGGVFLSRY